MTPRAVLVTGAAGGIGAAVTARLLRRGWPVLATDVDRDALEHRAREAGWVAGAPRLAALDVRDPEAWDAAVERASSAFGRLDLVVNAAGVIAGAPAAASVAEEVHRQVDVNLKGVVFGTAAAVRVMAPRGGGHIIHLGSMAGLMPRPGLAVYAASKYGVRGFCLSAAEELEPAGIALTVVSPATVATPMLDALRPYLEAEGVPLPGHAMDPREVADAVLSPSVLEGRPRELHLPRVKGLVARAVDLLPGPALRAATLVARLRSGR